VPARARVVIDTNVFISAILTPRGTARRAVDISLDRFIIALSAETALELEEKLTADKFRSVLSSADVDEFLDSLVQGTEFFVPTVFWERSRDPKDDRFLNLAETVGAAYLVTGDDDLLALESSHGVPGLHIVRPADFLRRVG
jgi:putative PIN family toxin of toxin-antitoxin system